MNITDWRTLLAGDHPVREVEQGIWSVLPPDADAHLYDGRAGLYDAVVGSRLYIRLVWGANIDRQREFARQAVQSGAGPLLDAACGSMLFSAAAHRDSSRLTIACDQSIAMLRRARARLTRHGALPPNIVLLQADVTSLPFKPAFESVLCMNVLHHIPAGQKLVDGLRNVLAVDGKLFLTTLVSGAGFLGNRFLNLLHKRGEFASPRAQRDIETMVRSSREAKPDSHIDGHMLYISDRK